MNMNGKQFVKVTCEDGIFFDLCNSNQWLEHIEILREGGYKAVGIDHNNVPPCIYRDFTRWLQSYKEVSWKNGKEFYFAG